jgi:hypothetical protein
MKKVVAISPEKGIFLGSVSGYAIFSKSDPIGLSSAIGFDSVETAQEFFGKALPNVANTMIFPEFETSAEHVSCVDIIKQGYEAYTHNMMDYMYMPSEAKH